MLDAKSDCDATYVNDVIAILSRVAQSFRMHFVMSFQSEILSCCCCCLDGSYSVAIGKQRIPCQD